jgi:signal transduction histidine kinase/ActR/RegA family two-component response regulator
MKPLQIVLLEDSPIDAELITEYLVEGGLKFDLERVDTKDDFLSKIGNDCLDLILADYSLPSFDGLSALKLAQSICPITPFIFVSGAIGEELAIETLKSGATDYVLKQRLQRLVPAVNRALHEAKEYAEKKRIEAERDELLKREKDARAEAEAANRAKDEFLATLSHELRTPLTAILGWSRLLRSRTMDESSINHALEVIERNAKMQSQLIEEILDISRIITGKLQLEMRAMDIAPVIEASIDIVRPTAESKSIEIVSSIESLSVPINGDPERLQQVIWNLLSNAIKFTPKDGCVAVTLRHVDAHIEIEVKDTGHGIEADFLPYVFDRFRQANSTSKRKYGGLGLGLAIVKHLVEMHGGTVHVNSDGIGKGATFKIRFPVAEVQYKGKELKDNRRGDVYEEPWSKELGSLNGTKVLLVEDDKDTREFLIHMLEQCGGEIRAASSVAEAIKAIEEFKPDVLVSDIEMPEEDGYDLIRRVRELEGKTGARLPAAALTAYARSEDRMRALRAGFQTHIPKPVNIAELTTVIANLALTKS